ncbi:uncharacterized protein LOC117501645 [Thalassophryne amazonica]|uniref:uncharacterized protein LOC117501645 n=1 Tax=Thalassophryne amazonica TaxID=390379 RepID=UPI0014719859|nr:uncharacterized protein LOC117501645 [Thalassophryne amazonica]
MFTLVAFCHLWVVISCNQNSTVVRFSVLEDHHLCLQCSTDDRSDVLWTHEDQRVLVTRQQDYKTNQDGWRFQLQLNGALCILQLDDSDSGTYHCNQQLVAEVTVLTGRDLVVSEGQTLLLPCTGSTKPKQRWFHRRLGAKREAIFTRFRNGTVRPETDQSPTRFSFQQDALQILDLQPEDAGEYLCNGQLEARVTILTVHPQTTSTMTQTPAVTKTDVVEIKENSEDALLAVAVVGCGVMILLMAAACVLLSSIKCKKKKKKKKKCGPAGHKHENTELQPFTRHKETEILDQTIHYASLGRQNWKERLSRTLSHQDQDRQDVIYSSVVTRPASS